MSTWPALEPLTKIALVVLNWNGLDDTRACLESLRSVDSEVQVIVVDNGSTDRSCEVIAELHPEVELLRTGANLGFSAGNNVGLRKALADGATHIGLLNNDTVVMPGFLGPLMRCLTAQPAAVASPDIRYYSDPHQSWFAGGVLDSGTGRPRHLLQEELPARGGKPLSTDLITGCCALATRETWEEVGLLDEDFFIIFEDADWSMRARALGHPLMVVPDSVIRHKVSRSFRQADVAALGRYYFARNGMEFVRRHGSPSGRRRTFLTQSLVRPTLREVKVSPRVGLRALLFVSLGVGAHYVRSTGPAPAWVVRLSVWRSTRHG